MTTAKGNITSASPVVIDLHGGASCAVYVGPSPSECAATREPRRAFMVLPPGARYSTGYTGWYEVAEVAEQGMVLVYPQGLSHLTGTFSSNLEKAPSWNAGSCCGSPDENHFDIDDGTPFTVFAQSLTNTTIPDIARHAAHP